MTGGPFPFFRKFRSERGVAVSNPEHQRKKSRHEVAALGLVIVKVCVVHGQKQSNQADQQHHHKEEALRLFSEPVRDHAKEEKQQEAKSHQRAVQQVKQHREMNRCIGERTDETADG